MILDKMPQGGSTVASLDKLVLRHLALTLQTSSLIAPRRRKQSSAGDIALEVTLTSHRSPITRGSGLI